MDLARQAHPLTKHKSSKGRIDTSLAWVIAKHPDLDKEDDFDRKANQYLFGYKSLFTTVALHKGLVLSGGDAML